MGLFTKKEVCPICGTKLKGDLLLKIKDNVTLCKNCTAAVNMESSMVAQQSVDDIRRHLAYREENKKKYDVFQSNLDIKVGAYVFKTDETQHLWYCTSNKKDKNPPLFLYSEIVGCQYTENGEPPVEEEKKSGLRALFGEKKEPVSIRSMKLHICLDNPYIQNIYIEMMELNDEIKSDSMKYKSNRKAAAKVMEALEGMRQCDQRIQLAAAQKAKQIPQMDERYLDDEEAVLVEEDVLQEEPNA